MFIIRPPGSKFRPTVLYFWQVSETVRERSGHWPSAKWPRARTANFEFKKRRQLFTCTHNVTLSVVAMRHQRNVSKSVRAFEQMVFDHRNAAKMKKRAHLTRHAQLADGVRFLL
jgi:hypothetical protein